MTEWTEKGHEPGVVVLHDWRWFARRAIDRTTVFIFFAMVTLAALPMGANRDWAWAPLCVMLGLVAIPIALGIGPRSGHSVGPVERAPLLVLIGCWVFFAAFAVWQTTTWTPLTADAWLFQRAAEILGSARAPIPAIAADAARNSLLKCVACALIFLMARAVCRDRDNARWFLMALVISGVLVVAYGIAMQMATNSCYLGSYLRKQFELTPTDRCPMGGTFVNSNSFACYMGMATLAAVALVFSKHRPRDAVNVPSGYDDEDDDVGFIDWFTGPRVVLLAVSLLMLGGMMMSASRAGFGATAAALHGARSVADAGPLAVASRTRPGSSWRARFCSSWSGSSPAARCCPSSPYRPTIRHGCGSGRRRSRRLACRPGWAGGLAASAMSLRSSSPQTACNPTISRIRRRSRRSSNLG